MGQRETQGDLQRWLRREGGQRVFGATRAGQGLRQLCSLSLSGRKRAKTLEERRSKKGDLSQKPGLRCPCLAHRVTSGPRLVRELTLEAAPSFLLPELSCPGHKFQSHLPHRELGFLTQPWASQSV